MGRFQLVVGAEVHGGGDGARREGGADDFAMACPGRLEFDADLEVDLIVQIEGNVPAGAFDLLGANDVPDDATGFGNDFGKLLQSCTTADDRERA